MILNEHAQRWAGPFERSLDSLLLTLRVAGGVGAVEARREDPHLVVDPVLSGLDQVLRERPEHGGRDLVGAEQLDLDLSGTGEEVYKGENFTILIVFQCPRWEKK